MKINIKINININIKSPKSKIKKNKHTIACEPMSLVVVRRAAVLQLLSCEDEVLLVRRAVVPIEGVVNH